MKTIAELQKEMKELERLKIEAIREQRYPDAADCRDKMQIIQAAINERLKIEVKK